MSIEERLRLLAGKKLEGTSVDALRERLGLPEKWAEILRTYSAAGARVSLSEQDDKSGFGAEIQLMDDTEMLSEAFDAYPGIPAVPRGYIPFGLCLEGSGDPYFLRVSDGAVVRVPHEAAREDSLDESKIEEVASSLEELFASATIE